MAFLTYLWLCWWKALPPPGVCTRASVCADVVPLWNVQHSPDSRLLKRHHQGYPRAHPGDDPHPLPCWASSGALLEGGPVVEQRGVERSLSPHPQGSGCTKSLLRRQRRSPRLGPCSKAEQMP